MCTRRWPLQRPRLPPQPSPRVAGPRRPAQAQPRPSGSRWPRPPSRAPARTLFESPLRSCRPSSLEAPPADELDLVVLVVSALRSAAQVDALEVGAREVVAERKREGAGRPPEADLGLEVIHAEEFLCGARRVVEQRAGDRRPFGLRTEILPRE